MVIYLAMFKVFCLKMLLDTRRPWKHVYVDSSWVVLYTYTYTHIYRYVCVYIHIYTHTHIHNMFHVDKTTWSGLMSPVNENVIQKFKVIQRYAILSEY